MLHGELTHRVDYGQAGLMSAWSSTRDGAVVRSRGLELPSADRAVSLWKQNRSVQVRIMCFNSSENAGI